MSQATTTYEKLLEAQNEQLRETIEKLVAETQACNKELDSVNQHNMKLVDGVNAMIGSAKVSYDVSRVSRRSSKESRVVKWSCYYYPNNAEPPKHMEAIYPIMREYWLDYLEGYVEGMKKATKNEANGSWCFFPSNHTKFPTREETKPPEATTP